MLMSLQLTKWDLPPQPDKYEVTRMVNLLSDPDDYHVVLLASMGFTYAVIARNTGLSKGQIAYRLHKANRHLKEDDKINAYNYRSGRSIAAQAVIDLAAKRVGRLITPKVREVLAIDL